MKKLALLIMAAAVAGISPAMAANHPTPTHTEAQAKPKAKAAGVKKLADDSKIRPGYKTGRLVVLDFNATWCGPCRQLTPVFDAAAKKYAKSAEFISIDIDRCPNTAKAFGIQAVPTVIFIYPDGKTKTFVGTDELLPAETFDKLVKAGIKK